MEISQTISSPSDACLREAASAKAGGRIKVAAGSESLWLGEGWSFDRLRMVHGELVEPSPSPSSPPPTPPK